MKFTDYYRILGIAPSASPEDLKTAYRKLARRYHPDTSREPKAEQRFIEIGEAHDVLKDPERRIAFDRLRGAGWKDGQEIPPPRSPESSAGERSAEAQRFSDFFASGFRDRNGADGPGGFRDRAYEKQSNDVHCAFPISLEEAYAGGERQFHLKMPARDHPGASDTRSITVKIPQGIRPGAQMRLRGQGHSGSHPEADGDLFLEVAYSTHRLFQTDGNDLSLDVPVAPWEAVLGAKIVVPTLGGKVTVTLAPGIQHGQKLRLKGRGLPGKPPGDQILVICIAIPTAVTDEEKAIYGQLAERSRSDPRERLASYSRAAS